MANILADGVLWQDLQLNTPPASWDSPNGWFEWFGVFGAGAPAQGMTYIGGANDLPASMVIRLITGTSLYATATYIKFLYITPGGNTFQEFQIFASDIDEKTLTIPATATGLQVSIRSGASYDYTYSMDITLTGVSAVDRAVTTCMEPGRVTRAFVSAYFRDRVHVSSLYASERRCLVANFNAVLGADQVIESVTWNTWNGSNVYMSNGAISGKEVQVTIAAQYAGHSIIRCTVTLDNGERYTQNFRVHVLSQPYYSGETYSTGPTLITVNA